MLRSIVEDNDRQDGGERELESNVEQLRRFKKENENARHAEGIDS